MRICLNLLIIEDVGCNVVDVEDHCCSKQVRIQSLLS